MAVKVGLAAAYFNVIDGGQPGCGQVRLAVLQPLHNVSIVGGKDDPDTQPEVAGQQSNKVVIEAGRTAGFVNGVSGRTNPGQDDEFPGSRERLREVLAASGNERNENSKDEAHLWSTRARILPRRRGGRVVECT